MVKTKSQVSEQAIESEAVEAEAETVSKEVVAEVATSPVICEEYKQGQGGRYTYDDAGNLVRVKDDNVEGK